MFKNNLHHYNAGVYSHSQSRVTVMACVMVMGSQLLLKHFKALKNVGRDNNNNNARFHFVTDGRWGGGGGGGGEREVKYPLTTGFNTNGGGSCLRDDQQKYDGLKKELTTS